MDETSYYHEMSLLEGLREGLVVVYPAKAGEAKNEADC
jgi:hypothetical protein